MRTAARIAPVWRSTGLSTGGTQLAARLLAGTLMSILATDTPPLAVGQECPQLPCADVSVSSSDGVDFLAV